MSNGNPFYVAPAQVDVSSAMQGFGSLISENREQRRKEQLKQGLMQAYQSGDPDQVAEFSAANPESSAVLGQMLNFRNEMTAKNYDDSLKNFLSNPTRETLVPMMEERTEQAVVAFESDPDSFIRRSEMALATRDPKAYEAYKEQKGIGAGGLKLQELDLKRQANDIRRLENEARKDEQMLKRETNELKRDELKLKIEEKRDKIDQKRKDVQAAEVSAVDTLDSSIAKVDSLLNHPGFEAAVGMSSAVPSIPGTERANFEAELESFDAALFTSAVKQMRGLGSLSDAEGKRISAAIGAISPRMTEEGMRKSLNTIKAGFELAKSRTNQGATAPTTPPTTELPLTDARGGQLTIDANGNKAYMYPDGTFQEVQ